MTSTDPFYDIMCYSTFGSFSFGGYMVLTCFWKNFINRKPLLLQCLTDIQAALKEELQQHN